MGNPNPNPNPPTPPNPNPQPQQNHALEFAKWLLSIAMMAWGAYGRKTQVKVEEKWKSLKYTMYYMVVGIIIVFLIALISPDAAQFAGVIGFIVTLFFGGWAWAKFEITLAVIRAISPKFAGLTEPRDIMWVFRYIVGVFLAFHIAMVVVPVTDGRMWITIIAILLTLFFICRLLLQWKTNAFLVIFVVFLVFTAFHIVTKFVFTESHTVLVEYAEAIHIKLLRDTQRSLRETKTIHRKLEVLRDECSTRKTDFSKKRSNPKEWQKEWRECISMEKEYQEKGTIRYALSDYSPMREYFSPSYQRANSYPIIGVGGMGRFPEYHCSISGKKMGAYAGTIFPNHPVYVFKAEVVKQPNVQTACKRYLQYQQRCIWKVKQPPNKKWCRRYRKNKKEKSRRHCFETLLQKNHQQVSARDLPKMNMADGEYRILVKKSSGIPEVPDANGFFSVRCWGNLKSTPIPRKTP